MPRAMCILRTPETPGSRKVGTNSIITTVAGNGTAGYSGDDGAATNANLQPYRTAVDAAGNLFIVDFGHNRVRKVNTSGVITTVAGNGVAGFSGDGGPATTKEMLNTPYGVAVDIFGNVFIADSNNNRIRKVTNTQGPALALNDVTPANSGNYQVVVTGPGGSVTSSAAILRSPLLHSFTGPFATLTAA